MDYWLGKWYIVTSHTTLYYSYAAETFHTQKLCSRLYSVEIKFLFIKNDKFAILSHPLGDLRVTYALVLWLIGIP